jgi:hypothetical protein
MRQGDPDLPFMSDHFWAAVATGRYRASILNLCRSAIGPDAEAEARQMMIRRRPAVPALVWGVGRWVNMERPVSVTTSGSRR